MGEEKRMVGGRLDKQNEEFLRELQQRWFPFVKGTSATLDMVASVLRAADTARILDLSLAGIQRLLRKPCEQMELQLTSFLESEETQGNAGEGTVSQSLGNKFPPRRISALSPRKRTRSLLVATTEVSVHPSGFSFQAGCL